VREFFPWGNAGRRETKNGKWLGHLSDYAN